jgi:chromosome segregation ATPase
MSTDIASAPHDASDLKDERRELQDELERLRDRRDRLKEQEDEARQEVQEIHESLSSGDLEVPPDELSDLKSERDSLKEARASVEDDIKDAKRRLAEIKAKLDSQDKVEALNEAVARCKQHRDGYEEAIEAAVEAATEQLEEAFEHLCGWREAQEQFKAQARRIFPSLGGGGRGDERTQKIRRALQALSSAGVDYEVALTSAPHYHAGRTHRATFDQYLRSEAGAHGEDLPVEGPIADRLYDRLEELEEQRR